MKRSSWLVGIVLVMVAIGSSGALAGTKVSGSDDSSGCGPGWYVTDKMSISASSTRSTTNAVIGPALTSAMTSGTSGCAPHPLVETDRVGATFAMANYDPLTMELAEGRGEYLENFARALGCDNSVIGDFGRITQEQYNRLVDPATGSNSGYDLYFRVKSEVLSNPVLSKSCSIAG